MTIITDTEENYNGGIFFSDKISVNGLMAYTKCVVVYFDELNANKICIPKEATTSKQILNKYKRFQERMKMEEDLD